MKVRIWGNPRTTSNINCLLWMYNWKWTNLSKIACLNINRRQTSFDKKHNLSLRLVLFFPFRCCFAGSLQFTSSTVKQTKLFHSKKNTSRKNFFVEWLRRGAASGKRLEKAGILARKSHTSLVSDWSALVPIGRSPFLLLWNLHKVKLFFAFTSHLDDISSWKCSWKCKSLQFERKKLIYKTVRLELYSNPRPKWSSILR